MAGLLVLLVIGVFLWLFNTVLAGWLRRRQSAAARDIERQGLPVVLHAPRPQTSPAVASRRTPSPAGPPLVATCQRVPMRLGSRQEVRRGMVLMTLLGPCRALEPSEPRR